jgi:hypothetical protein
MTLSLSNIYTAPSLGLAQPQFDVSALSTHPSVTFGNQVVITATPSGSSTPATLVEGVDWNYNRFTDKVTFVSGAVPTGATILFSMNPSYTSFGDTFSDLGSAPAKATKLRDDHLLTLCQDLDTRINLVSTGSVTAVFSLLNTAGDSINGNITLQGDSNINIGFSSQVINFSAPQVGTNATNIGTLQTSLGTAETNIATLQGKNFVPDTATASTNNVVTYDSTGNIVWAAPTGGSGGDPTNLNGLSDVTLNSVSANQVLVSDGSGLFTNQNFAASSITGLAAVATSGSYSDLINEPNITWTDSRSSTATCDIELLQANNTAGSVLRYDGSNFKLAKLDFDDLAGGVGFQDLTGTPNFGIEALNDVANYDPNGNDALKIAQLNSTGTQVTWQTLPSQSAGEAQIWSAYFDYDPTAVDLNDVSNPGGVSPSGYVGFRNNPLWDFQGSTAPGQLKGTSGNTTIIDWDANDTNNTVVYTTLNPPGTLISSGSGSGFGFNIASAGVYRIRLQGTFAAFSDSQIDKLSMAVLKNDPTDGNFVYSRDPVIARADTNVSSGDNSGADNVVVSLSCERIISLLSTDRLFCVVNLSTSNVYMTSGNWIIEKLG